MKLSGLFTDHAVLQREIPIPIWGWTIPKTRVKIEMGSFSVESFAGMDGKFLIRLPAMSAGGPYDLVVTEVKSGERVVVTDVWVGEVWLASGQSNMEWTLTAIGAAGERDAAQPLPTLRMINIPRHAFAGRQADFAVACSDENTMHACLQKPPPPSWLAAGGADTGAFSAVAYYFGRELQNALGVAVGIINTSWGGTIVEAWTSRETLSRNPDLAGTLARYEDTVFSRQFWGTCADTEISGLPRASAGAYPADPGNDGVKKRWNLAEFDDAAWPAMRLPSHWNSQGHPYSGVFWFRKTIDIPPTLAGKELRLGLGAVDKQDTTYFNGELVGATGSGFQEEYWNLAREYRVPGKLVKPGRNIIAVRAYSFVYGGGMIGPSSQMQAVPVGGAPISLAGEWRYQEEHNLGVVAVAQALPGPGNANSPYMLFDNMIAPLLPYALRGAVWYQGESNANNARQYRRMMVDLIRDWRFHWGLGDFPFIQVQLANFADSEADDWPRLREAQLQVLAEPNTGMAVAIDIGEKNNIHPANKREVGHRLSRWALAHTYGRQIIPSGPIFKGLSVEGNKIRLRFDYVGGGLVARGDALQGFTIADSAQKFLPAQAKIEGDSVLVNGSGMSFPLAVRYAWNAYPECNLYNREGLPASPFRTDNWN